MEIRLPKLGEGADSGTVISVLVKEGDQVQQDQTIIELENEKAVASIPSTSSGKVSKIHVKAGDKISAGQVILSLSSNGSGGVTVEKGSEPAKKIRPAQRVEEQMLVDISDDYEDSDDSSASALPPAASPSTRKIARELGIDLRKVKGSERGGRIVMPDIRDYIARLQRNAAGVRKTQSVTSGPPSAESVDFSKWGPVRKESISPLRKTIARRMWESWASIPHVTQFENVDVTDILALKKKNEAAYEKKGARLTLTSFILKAVVNTLKEHPKFNSSLDENTNEQIFKAYYHIGIAVDSEAGLMVPVIKDADKKNLLALSKDLQQLAEKTRSRKISADEMQGGTFTISNQGGIGGAHFTPIIKKPEAAILGIGRGKTQAVVRDGKIEPRMIVPLGLSYDHRIIDGGDAARFIKDLVIAIEQFESSDAKIS